MGFELLRNALLMVLLIDLTMAMTGSKPDLETPNSQLPGSRWTVYIFNKMTDGGTLFLHCKSKDDDMGIHRVTMDMSFEFSFKESFWQRTLFWCDFQSRLGHVSFEVYWPERKHRWLQDHCDGGNCVWSAKDDGIYLRNNKLNMDDYKHDWDKTYLRRRLDFLFK